MADTATHFDAIRDMLVDILGVDAEEVVPDARFFQDLNGESIDVLDLHFRLKQHYQVDIPIQELASAQSLDVTPSGHITEAALNHLATHFPALDVSRIVDDPRPDRLGELFTVKAIVGFVEANVM
jgi:acyl carrier protein